MKQYFPALFKRRAFHSFKDVGGTVISQDELDDIERVYPSFKPLYKDIETAIRIVPTKDASYKSEAEYCILIYSEKKDNYLMNVGYIGEQLDLYLVSKNIG
ncbi:MAG TPA: nitroreductase, partial [Erysipelotrichaceae bacterium]|nr:nitroreductase [Erysipelotrichaceae bacterium]